LTGQGTPGPDPTDRAVKERVSRLAESAQEGSSSAVRRTSLDQFDLRHLRKLDQILRLREEYATWFKWLLLIQIGVADGVFVLYAWLGKSWDVPAAAISAWLGAVVIQVIGIVLVITRGLFPPNEVPGEHSPHN
jgi:hypothetical protein